MTQTDTSDIKCCIWNMPDISRNVLSRSLLTVEIMYHEPHFTRKILKCKKCGQLFLYQFNEDIDWIDGNDEQYYKWIPVHSLEAARQLGEKSILQLLNTPSIRIDFTKKMKGPKGPYKYDFS